MEFHIGPPDPCDGPLGVKRDCTSSSLQKLQTAGSEFFFFGYSTWSQLRSLKAGHQVFVYLVLSAEQDPM